MANKRIQYGFDTSADPLQENDLLDVKTANSVYLTNSLKDDLHMNGFRVRGAGPALQRDDLVTQG
jgi:hypothetical protein